MNSEVAANLFNETYTMKPLQLIIIHLIGFRKVSQLSVGLTGDSQFITLDKCIVAYLRHLGTLRASLH